MTGSLIIRIGEQRLALPIDPVVEVCRMVAVAASLPRAPRDCLGVVDFHGQLVPLIDLGARLGLSPRRPVNALVDAHLVVLKDPLGAVAYAVDEVRELSELSAEPLPEGGARSLGKLALGMVRLGEGQVVPQLDPSTLLSVLSRHQLREALAEMSAS
jgi:purine-binding chemotaxis protein CheW